MKKVSGPTFFFSLFDLCPKIVFGMITLHPWMISLLFGLLHGFLLGLILGLDQPVQDVMIHQNTAVR